MLSLLACSSSKDEGQAKGPDTNVTTCDDGVASASKPCSTDPDPCGLKSGYAGDEYCIAPPPPGKGIQIHFGPSNYTDAAEVAKYVLKAGEEFNSYGTTKIPTDTDHWYNYTQIRMRPGSHHLINTVVQGENIPEGYAPAGRGCPGTTVGGFPGTQNLIRNMPAHGQQAPENVGLGSMLPGNSYLCVNHHAYNYAASGPAARSVDQRVVRGRGRGNSKVLGSDDHRGPVARHSAAFTEGAQRVHHDQR